MNKKLINLTGQRFGRLVVLCRDTVEIGKTKTKSGQFGWQCKCDCGNLCVIRSGELRYGSTKSCGCLRKELNLKHGHTTHNSKSKTNSVWNAMVQRCTNPRHSSYHRYGGRGITVYAPWMDFINFLKDMGEAPEGLTLERVDNDGPYAPWNCCWATWEQQNKNKHRRALKPRINGLPHGVNKHGRKFTAAVTIKRKRHYLGVFTSVKDAERAVSLCLRAHGLK